ncbi:DoxX family protein [Bosea sp. 2RAB26]|uniref:DoxX family protein n=1 Tax=Bosea sp. 2RAB26 TaxID=3237476 RepID=UPI003F92368A
MAENLDKQRAVIPKLAPLYAALEPLAYAAMRATSGLIMATFGWTKLFGDGMTRDIELFQRLGLEPAVPLAYFTSGLELLGGLAIAIGLLTRPLAFMLFIQLVVILVMVMIPRGTGYHLTVVWLGTFALMSVHGGGRLSLDRWLGREF